jgi:hypothetical protein
MPTETGAGDLSDSAVRAQLDSILASAVFSRSPHLRRFLSVHRRTTLAGQGPRLKEAVLASRAIRQRHDFDAGNDPVVRVDARRLRDKLREFYEGRSDPIVIALPKGSYVPVFEARSPSRAALPETRTGHTSHAHENCARRCDARVARSDDGDDMACTARAGRRCNSVISPGPRTQVRRDRLLYPRTADWSPSLGQPDPGPTVYLCEGRGE